jgi:hypothetical protein
MPLILKIALAVIVTIVWLVGYTLAYATGGEPPQELTALMVIVVSAVFASEVKTAIKRRLNGVKEDDAPES